MDRQTEIYLAYMRARIDSGRDPERLSAARLHAAYRALDASFIEWCRLMGYVGEESAPAEEPTRGGNEYAAFDTMAAGLHALQRQAELKGEESPVRVEFNAQHKTEEAGRPTPINEVIAHAKKQVVPLKEATA